MFLIEKLMETLEKIPSGVYIGVGLIFTTIITVVFTNIRKWLWGKAKAIWSYFSRINAALNAVKTIQENGTVREGEGVWLAKPIHHPDHYETNIEASNILSIANLKGGVGKSTIAANLAACLSMMLNFDINKQPYQNQKPILLIDLDFQGTLAGFANPPQAVWPPDQTDSHATKLIRKEWQPEHLRDVLLTADDRPMLKIIPAYYDLAKAENRLMVEWLVGNRINDVRYILAKILHDPLVRNQFRLIIIDCPPRLTTAAIQAFCASSHLLIPTILEEASSTAVNSFVRQIESLKRNNICPYIEYIGVVGSMVPPQQKEFNIIFELDDILQSSWEKGGADGVISTLDLQTFIPKYKAIADSYGQGIIYPIESGAKQSENINKAIENLSLVIKEKMGLVPG